MVKIGGMRRTCSLVVNCPRRTHSGVAEARPQLTADAGGGRLLKHLLMAPLHRAVSLEEVERPSVRIAEDLVVESTRRIGWRDQKNGPACRGQKMRIWAVESTRRIG